MGIFNRKLTKPDRRHFRWDTYSDGYGGSTVRAVPDEDDAELVSSEGTDGLHYPVIDLDFECELVPSSTPGHYHLYINEGISWERYIRLLEGFLEAGLIQKGWFDEARKDKRTYVRRKGIYKPFDELREKLEAGAPLFE